jgi:hypothetical protein
MNKPITEEILIDKSVEFLQELRKRNLSADEKSLVSLALMSFISSLVDDDSKVIITSKIALAMLK